MSRVTRGGVRETVHHRGRRAGRRRLHVRRAAERVPSFDARAAADAVAAVPRTGGHVLPERGGRLRGERVAEPDGDRERSRDRDCDPAHEPAAEP
jgi:hypothetical protein